MITYLQGGLGNQMFQYAAGLGMARLLGETLEINIGSENKLFSMSGSSMIAAPFRDSQQKIVGVLGIIGPTRLNYAKVVPMVDYTAKIISKLIESGRA
jgi:heat-inducible transcriptional repressor